MRVSELKSSRLGQNYSSSVVEKHNFALARTVTYGHSRAFTLVELLITASIVALVAIAILSVFAGGLRVYERARDYSDIRADILLSFEKMEQSLRDACNISTVAFVGSPGKVTFPAALNMSIGSISYYVDDNYLVSEERDYSGATAEEPSRGIVTKLAAAEDIKFSYYSYDPETTAYSWDDTWEADKEKDKDKPKKKISVNTPLGLRMEAGYDDNGQRVLLSRTVFFPLAVSLHYAELEKEKTDKAKGAATSEKKG